MRFRSPLASVLILALAGCGTHPAPRAEPPASEVPAGPSEAYVPPASAFDGDAEELRATDMVPTLDTPLRPGRSAVWCAGVPAMWKALEREVTHGPVVLLEDSPEADRLNAAPDPTGDIRPECLFTAAGYVSDGIVERIRSGMGEKFPDKTLPDFSDVSPDGVIAYAYLDAEVPFSTWYDDLREPLVFHCADGSKVLTLSFGVIQGCNQSAKNSRIRYFSGFSNPLVKNDFAIELDVNQKVDQVVVACTDNKGTLGEMYESVQRKIREASTEDEFTPVDTLELPPILFSVKNDFPSIVGKTLRLPSGLATPIERMSSKMNFRLDRKGAHVEEEVILSFTLGGGPSPKPQPRDFRFDRPFLLYMKKRGAERPYFVMWVANAELLCKWPDSSVQKTGGAL